MSTSGAEEGGRGAPAILALVTLILFTDIMIYDMVVPLLPDYARMWGIDQTGLGLLSGAYGLAAVHPRRSALPVLRLVRRDAAVGHRARRVAVAAVPLSAADSTAALVGVGDLPSPRQRRRAGFRSAEQPGANPPPPPRRDA